MTNPLDTAPVQALGQALDGATLRHRVIAHNIANANTPGFTPLRVSFEKQFDAALKPVVEPAAGGKVELDVEMAQLAQNSLQYQALLRGLGRYLAILGAAISEGKR